jgi:hypothetical protein
VTKGGVAFKQIPVVPAIVAVGNAFTFTVTDPVGDPLHTVLLTSTTPVRLYTKAPTVEVGTGKSTDEEVPVDEIV